MEGVRISYIYEKDSTKQTELIPGFWIETGDTSSIGTISIIEASSKTQIFRYVLNSSEYEVQNNNELKIVNFKDNTTITSADDTNLASFIECFPVEFSYEDIHYSDTGKEKIEWPQGTKNEYQYEEYVGTAKDETAFIIRFYYSQNNDLQFFRILSPHADGTSLFLVQKWNNDIPSALYSLGIFSN